MTNTDLVVVLVFLLAVAACRALWVARSGRMIVDRWAARTGHELLECSHSYLGGPFWRSTAVGQSVFRVLVRDGDGVPRRAYLRCRPVLVGTWIDAVEIAWDA